MIVFVDRTQFLIFPAFGFVRDGGDCVSLVRNFVYDLPCK